MHPLINTPITPKVLVAGLWKHDRWETDEILLQVWIIPCQIAPAFPRPPSIFLKIDIIWFHMKEAFIANLRSE